MSGLRGVTLTVRFLCELAMLAALAFWGFGVAEGLWGWVLGIGAPVLAAAALAAAGQPLAAVVLGVAGVATSLLNEAQERQAGPGDLQRGRR